MCQLQPTQKIVFISTFPPTQCGIATFTNDTIRAISALFGKSIKCEIAEVTFNNKPNLSCAYHLPSREINAYEYVAHEINKDDAVKLVHIQHEFGLFGGNYGDYLFHFLNTIQKPIIYTFHSVIAQPHNELKTVVQLLCSYSKSIIVMTQKSKETLILYYGIKEEYIEVIPHGTHLVNYEPTEIAKQKFGLENRMVLSTFGLIGQSKSIETGIKAMTTIIKDFPNALYLILGKTHPNTIIDGVDTYRDTLKNLIKSKSLEHNIKFVDEYLETHELLDYLKATDIYLFTSKDPNQAVSGTFSYAMSCSCPVIASKIPHTVEYLTSDMGILVDIQNEKQFAKAAIKLLKDTTLRYQMGLNAYAKTTETSWENTALKHLNIYQKVVTELNNVKITYPEIKLQHLKKLTTNIGVIQFCKISEPDLSSGYTLDDNARALILMCNYYKLTQDEESLIYIKRYLSFIKMCQLDDGRFINYIDKNQEIEEKNYHENLEDANGRALWALGTFMTLNSLKITSIVIDQATDLFNKGLIGFNSYQSPRALAFAIKGLYQAYSSTHNDDYYNKIIFLADKLVQNYTTNTSSAWHWFEHKLTYANSVLSEALLLSYLISKKEIYKEIALESLDFLSSKMFVNGDFKIISNKGWYQKDVIPYSFGEQPIEACYMMQTLDVFYTTFEDEKYKNQLKQVFNWFLGKNHLKHIIYNPITGGCYDGLEKENVNLNQGAESTICYLMARILIEKYTGKGRIIKFSKNSISYFKERMNYN